MTVVQTDKIERAKAHLATCMERDDFPSHNCACDCGDVSELLAEVERLRIGLRHIRDVAHNATVGSESVSHWWYRQEAIRVLGDDQQ